MTLQEILSKASADLEAYKADASKVIEDQKLLTADQAKAAASGGVARGSVADGIKALTDELSGLPAAE